MNTPGQHNPEEEPREPVGSSESADATERRANPERPSNAPGASNGGQRTARGTEQFARDAAYRLRPVARRTTDRIVRWLRQVLAALATLTQRVVRRAAPYARRAHAWLVSAIEGVQRRIDPVARRVWQRLSPVIEPVRQRLAPTARRIRDEFQPRAAKLRARLPESSGRHRAQLRSRSVQLTAAVAAFGVLAILVGTAGPDTGERSTPAAHTVELRSPDQAQSDGSQSDQGGTEQDSNSGQDQAQARAENPDSDSAPEAKSSPSESAVDIPPNAHGIDVSNHNGPIQWNKVAASGEHYAFVLATDGGNFTNPMFDQQFNGAKNAGMLAGAYHFGRPTGSAVGQADRLLNTVGSTDDGKTLPPVLDLEVSPNGGGCYGKTSGQLHSWTQSFLDRVKSKTGQDAIVYASPSFWSSCMAGSQAFSENPLWLASYGVPQPSVFGGWDAYSFWQYTNKGSVPGITGPVDRNLFQGSGSDLLELTR
ncbi:GH25 family lysozyme [Actinopolyspora mzabensis]|uniref:GH25 family lysozyme n=1 Tax=Actinopolyspora mzabensis TaxID=995066 RepID=UPI000B80A58D|nr:GH25 family lysozyme [Actinopolyspora mzabensis]